MTKNKFILEQGLYLAWAVALIATGGSLYLSEVLGYTPCTFCWYQRILMYPLVIILGIAAARKDYKQTVYGLPFSIMGMMMSTYHYLTQKVQWLAEAGNGCGIIPCNIDYINWLGFITIPFLALIAFIMITIIQLLVCKASKTV